MGWEGWWTVDPQTERIGVLNPGRVHHRELRPAGCLGISCKSAEVSMTKPIERGKIPRTEWAEIHRRAEEYLRKTNGAPKKRPEVPPERPPMVFGYRRISPGDSKHGLDAQIPAVEAYFNLLKADEPNLTWGEWFADNHESAFKKRFLERPEGRRLHTTLRRGDHIIFAKFDRAFRQARDAHNMLAMWQERGIHIHFADLRVDTNTAHGRLFLSLLAAGSRK